MCGLMVWKLPEEVLAPWDEGSGIMSNTLISLGLCFLICQVNTMPLSILDFLTQCIFGAKFSKYVLANYLFIPRLTVWFSINCIIICLTSSAQKVRRESMCPHLFLSEMGIGQDEDSGLGQRLGKGEIVGVEVSERMRRDEDSREGL